MRGKNWDLNPRLHFLYCPDSTVGVQRRLLVGGGEELRHALWMCWVGGAHETSRRRVEFVGWGRSNSTEKEFVSGSYILTSAYWEPQFRSNLWWNFQTAILAAHQQGCSEVCAWFSRPIFRSCSQGLFFFFFFWHVSGLLSSTCIHSAVSIFLKGLCNLLSYDSPLRCASVRYWVVWHWVEQVLLALRPWKWWKPRFVGGAEDGELVHQEVGGPEGSRQIWWPRKALVP